MERLNDNPILAAHVNELDPAYRLFQGLNDDRLRAEAARLIDFLHGEEIAVPLDLPPAALPFLRAAVEAAHPDRKCLGLLAARFGAWLGQVKLESQPAFLKGLASLGPAIADLGEVGMGDVILAVNRDPRLMASIGSYALTTKPIVLAIAKLAVAAPIDLIQRLVAAVPVAKMEDNKDAERLVPALAKVPEALAGIVTLAERNQSSAYGACQGLPAAFKKLTAHAVDRADFLEDFRLLAETVGISSVGFALHTLPDFYGKLGRERARQFVFLAAECARQYGPGSGQAFLERKTAASREACSRIMDKPQSAAS